ncbi:MAG TPA: 16S rRNA (adenine(1518)-N(6)/adenine(1519)-N(6))-dimethyltransferase RsmA [Candidatus Thermoplasmatota archaeon]|nr:16S rRNA (adenine(1518)-N(6)/adenine(1519)-N(6))-dimethyltransferase RsmA [Candidatus Thermoplasmatota archaeon]
MAKQRFGQHFLIDSSVAKREVAYATLTKNDVVLEIGPGKGIITRLLAQQAKQVIAIEIDKRLVEQLKTTLPENVTLICHDALSVDFKTLPTYTKIVSNLPFEISSPIMFKFLESTFSKAILIFQKDFALRLVASPGTKEYSRLTVGVSYKAGCRILEDVPRSCFSPAPTIDASIVELIPYTEPKFTVENEQFFLTLTKQLFTHRRKKIRYTIKSEYGDIDQLPYLDLRVEDLTAEQIGELSNELYHLI